MLLMPCKDISNMKSRVDSKGKTKKNEQKNTWKECAQDAKYMLTFFQLSFMKQREIR